VIEYLDMAADIAALTGKHDKRTYLLGAVGIRARDGVLVSARNGSYQSSASNEDFRVVPASHAENRCLAKMGKAGGILYVARAKRGVEKIGMARPCAVCQMFIRNANISMVYYTIDEHYYGSWNPFSDHPDGVYEC